MPFALRCRVENFFEVGRRRRRNRLVRKIVPVAYDTVAEEIVTLVTVFDDFSPQLSPLAASRGSHSLKAV